MSNQEQPPQLSSWVSPTGHLSPATRIYDATLPFDSTAESPTVVHGLSEEVIRSIFVGLTFRGIELAIMPGIVTPAETRVLTLYAAGVNRRQAGEWLGISNATLKAHTSRLRSQLSAFTEEHLVGQAFAKGIFEVGDPHLSGTGAALIHPPHRRALAMLALGSTPQAIDRQLPCEFPQEKPEASTDDIIDGLLATTGLPNRTSLITYAFGIGTLTLAGLTESASPG